MSGKQQHKNLPSALNQVVVGIDVGGSRKGFHAVALKGGKYSGQYASKDVGDLVGWCREIDAIVVAVDAPCRWSKDGRARPAERELMKKGIWCFSTPTVQRAIEHPKNHFGWMLRGEELFQALAPSHPVCYSPFARSQKCSIETFPHAVAWHLTGGKAIAREKHSQRRSILERAKIDLSELTKIDLVDAAICALTAHCFCSGGEFASYGEADTGYIIVQTHLNEE